MEVKKGQNSSERHNKFCPKGHGPQGSAISVFQWLSEQLTEAHSKRVYFGLT